LSSKKPSIIVEHEDGNGNGYGNGTLTESPLDVCEMTGEQRDVYTECMNGSKHLANEVLVLWMLGYKVDVPEQWRECACQICRTVRESKSQQVLRTMVDERERRSSRMTAVVDSWVYMRDKSPEWVFVEMRCSRVTWISLMRVKVDIEQVYDHPIIVVVSMTRVFLRTLIEKHVDVEMKKMVLVIESKSESDSMLWNARPIDLHTGKGGVLYVLEFPQQTKNEEGVLVNSTLETTQGKKGLLCHDLSVQVINQNNQYIKN
jgi:hypothetical protein